MFGLSMLARGGIDHIMTMTMTWAKPPTCNGWITLALLSFGCGNAASSGHDKTLDGSANAGPADGAPVDTSADVSPADGARLDASAEAGIMIDSGVGGTVYTLDLKGFGLPQGPGGLEISNETLVFPIALGATEQTLSRSNPGDLVVKYTRVGCWVEPEAWIGAHGVVSVQRWDTQPVGLTSVVIDQFVGVGVTASPRLLAENTCVTLRSQGGPWTTFFRPSKITMLTPESVRAEFVIDRSSADSVAIFFSTYTYVSKISYRVVSP